MAVVGTPSTCAFNAWTGQVRDRAIGVETTCAGDLRMHCCGGCAYIRLQDSRFYSAL
jgi:hypothetical protein